MKQVLSLHVLHHCDTESDVGGITSSYSDI